MMVRAVAGLAILMAVASAPATASAATESGAQGRAVSVNRILPGHQFAQLYAFSISLDTNGDGLSDAGYVSGSVCGSGIPVLSTADINRIADAALQGAMLKFDYEPINNGRFKCIVGYSIRP